MKSPREIYREYKEGDLRVRNRMTARFSIALNFGVAVFKAIFGIITASAFYFVAAFYSLILGISRRTYYRGAVVSHSEEARELRYYFQIAVMLGVAALVYMAYMVRLFFMDEIADFGLIIAIVIAATSFTELGFAIHGLVKANKNKDLLVSALKIVNFSSALVAIVLTESALLGYCAETTPDLMPTYCFATAVFGMAIGSISVFLSVLMIINYAVRKHRLLLRGVDVAAVEAATDVQDFNDGV